MIRTERFFRPPDAIFTPKHLLDLFPELPPLPLFPFDIATAIQQREHLPPLPLPELQQYQDNPWQYSGLHPIIHRHLAANQFQPHQRVLPQPPHPKSEPYTIFTEPLKPPEKDIITVQQQLLRHFPGIIHTLFVSRGYESFWRSWPLAKRFATDPHQMSIPYLSPQRGTSFILTTPSPSKVVPHEWLQQPFPTTPDTNQTTSTTLFSFLHQICHALNLPPAWEYLDKTYSLLTWEELIHLTSLRYQALQEWYSQYATGQLNDTTVYLYELKLVQRALLILSQYPKLTHPQANSLPDYIQAIRFPEIFAQLQIQSPQQEAVIHLLANTPSTPEELNSHDPRIVFFLTSYGTHQEEEIIVDTLHRYLLGEIPTRAWKTYLDYLLSIWNRWLTSHSLPPITPLKS